jgi:hypothetical protein
MLNISSHKENANQNNEISPHSNWNVHYQEQKMLAKMWVRDMGEEEP